MRIGEKRGRLTLVKEFRKDGRSWGEFKCSCGKTKEARIDSCSLSCGCYYKETRGKTNLKHGCGVRGTTEYQTYSSWQHIKERCLNPNNKYYKNYGGRGITICEEWMNFENFLSDMGLATDGYSIDRIDNDGNYNKENCKWASFQEQMNNTRRSHFLEYNGEKKTIADWAREKNMSYEKLINRIKRGWSVKDSLEKQ